MVVEEPTDSYLSLTSFLRLSLAVLVVGSILGVAAMFYAMNAIDDSSGRANERANAAVLLSQAQSDLDSLVTMLNDRADVFLGSQEVFAQAPADRVALRTELNRQDTDSRGPVLPPLLITLPVNDALTFQRSLDGLLARSDAIIKALNAGQKKSDDRGLLVLARQSMDTYNRAPNVLDFRLLRANLVQLRLTVREAVPQVLDGVHADQDSARTASTIARWGLFGAALLLVCLVTVVVWLMGKRVASNLHRYEQEREELNEATERLKFRNTQLNALYNVFSEITDTLSLPYVVSATTREALRVMNADMAVLRLLRGDELVAVGNLTSEGIEVPDLPPVRLGETATGRAAKRGHTIRLKEDAQSQLGPNGPTGVRQDGGVQSGIVVPLIVGARVVGTLACWSFKEDAFNDEDERVLEMMASQVATAVVVADTTEASERRAHQDALTGLPNRLQLSEDMQGDLKTLAAAGRRAVIAMADIDHFKNVNDDYSHHLGDVVLQQVAHVLRSSVRGSDRVYRYGGEEFVIIFMDADPQTGFELADRVRHSIGTTPLSGDNLQPITPVTISIGLVSLPEHGNDIEALIELADGAMYQAKDAGRNRVIMYRAEDTVLTHVA